MLDFFAGSGTTGHAVLALNAQDGGQRRFILCSSTEATSKEPAKNLCRDVCAERLRRVIARDGHAASFAYLQLDKIAPGDAPFDAGIEQAFQLLTLRLGQVARPMPAADRGVLLLARNPVDDSVTALCHRVSHAALEALAALPARTLRVYSPRPATVQAHFEALGRTIESLPLGQALLQGQQNRRSQARRAPSTPGTSQNAATT